MVKQNWLRLQLSIRFCRQSRRNKITKAGSFVKLRRRLRLAPQALDFVAPQALSEGCGLRNSIL
jgi:hypothetical protein